VGVDEKISFRLLGPFDVLVDGVSVDLGGPKQRGLLARLLVNAGRVVSIDRLLDDLWPGATNDGAIASLQSYVSRLRRQLQPMQMARRRDGLITTVAPGYRLDVDPATIDAAVFERLVDAARAAHADGRADAARDAYVSAFALWRGPALEEFRDEPFALAEAARLDEIHSSATEEHLALVVEADPALGLPHLEAAVVERPERERRWALLMIALYRAGRQADSLRAYQRARAALGEFGIDPGPALQELERQVLAQAPGLQAATATPTRRSMGPVGPVTPNDVSDRRRLVGRERELESLLATIAGASAGGASVALVAGEPGIGKSKLLLEVSADVSGRGVSVGWGGGVEGEQRPALWPWTRALRRLVAQRDAEAMRARAGSAFADLGQLDPELAEAVGVEPALPPADPAVAHARILRSVIQALDALASEGNVVVVLDDLQWADAPTLQLLRLCSVELTSAVTILGAYRSREVSDALADAVAAVRRLDRGIVLDLDGLGPDAVGALIDIAVDRTVSDEVARLIGERTSGNPLFVIELSRFLEGHNRLDASAATGADVPDGVRALIERRLDRLPDQTRTALSLAAVIGKSFDITLLQAVLDVPVDDVLDRIDVAVALGVIEEAGAASTGDYVFGHDLVRDTLYQSLAAPRRARLHERVADALEAMSSDVGTRRVFEIARHLELASEVVDRARTITALVAAADAAVQQFDLGRADSLIARALTSVERLTAGVERDAHEARVRLREANLRTLTAGYAAPATGAAFARAAELLHALPAGAERLHARWGYAVFSGVGGNFAEALRVGVEAAAEAAAAGDAAAEAAFEQVAGTFSWHLGRYEDAAAHLERAVFVQDAHDLDLRPVTLHDVAVAARSFHALAAWAAGDDESADALIADALARAEVLGDPFDDVVARFFAGWLAALRGDREQTLRHVVPVIASADEHGFTQYGPMARVLAAWADGSGEAIDGLAAGLEAAAATGARMLGHFFLTLLGDALLRLGRLDAAEETLRAARRESADTGERFFAVEALRLLAEVEQARGNASAAASHLRTARDEAGATGAAALGRRVEATMSTTAASHQ
jgi:DNA-binding SARP family transcriptional activator/tetratricopeptide (TPR) repeat protein